MPTRDYTNNVVALAGLALDAYQPDRVLYQALQPIDDEDRLEDGTLFATVAGDSRDLRSVNAVFGAVQLAFDAAMVVASYTAELPGEGEGERNIDFLRNLASEPTWTLEIEELSDGSFRVKLRAVFATPQRRSTLIAAAVIATAILNIIVPAAIVPTLVVAAVGGAETILENVLKERLDRRQERRAQGGAAPSADRRVQRVRDLHQEGIRKTEDEHLRNEIAGLRETVAALAAQVTDLRAAAAANVTVIRFEITTVRQAVA